MALLLAKIFGVPAAFIASWTGDSHSGGCGEPRDRLLRGAPPTCIPLPPNGPPPDRRPSLQRDRGRVRACGGGGDKFFGARVVLELAGILQIRLSPIANQALCLR